VPAADRKKPNMSDEPHDPLAVLRVPPTAQQVVEHIYEELEHAISMACSARAWPVHRLFAAAPTSPALRARTRQRPSYAPRAARS
jgi:hypothetical protein